MSAEEAVKYGLVDKVITSRAEATWLSHDH